MYTDSQIKSANKENLTTMALDMKNTIEALKSQPMTSGAVERRLLDISEKANKIQAEEEESKRQHDLEKKRIENEASLSIKKLELEYNSKRGLTIEQVNAQYKEIEEAVKKAKDNLDLGLKKKEIEISEQTTTLIEKYDVLKAELEAKHEVLKKETQEKTEKIVEDSQNRIFKANEDVAKVKQENERTLEELAYDHKIAIRDKNLELANTIAKETGNTIINTKELEVIKAYKEDSEANVTNKIETAVKDAESKLHAKYNGEASKAKAESELKVQLLEKDKEYLTNENKSLKDRIESLQDELAKVPGQIKEAVAASRAEINVNQDNKK